MSAIVNFRKKLKSGNVCVGLLISCSDPLASEAIGASADFFWYDLEHCPLSAEVLNGHLLAARACQVPSLVRVPAGQTCFIKPVLDSGANGIIVPMVRNAQEVKSIVSDCRYPPQGTRGFGPRILSKYGRESGDVVVEREDHNVFVSVMIETAEALEDIENIVGVEGLDSVVIGPCDLSFSLGVGLDLEHPKVVKAEEIIIAKAKAAGVFVGVGLGSSESEDARIFVERGVDWLTSGFDFRHMISSFEKAKMEIQG
jgi:2-keto-3-deoxy-L-rhamnonate aldolase RhmA